MSSKPTAKAQPQDKFVVRFPDGLRDQIAEEAKTAGRSMNAEIVTRLEWSLGTQLLDQVEQLHNNLDAVRSLSARVDALRADIKAHEMGDSLALEWLTGGDTVLDEKEALSAARLALETMEERLYALRSSIGTIYHEIKKNGREPAYYKRKF